jgi:hypothetical protein
MMKSDHESISAFTNHTYRFKKYFSFHCNFSRRISLRHAQNHRPLSSEANGPCLKSHDRADQDSGNKAAFQKHFDRQSKKAELLISSVLLPTFARVRIRIAS